MAEAGGTKNVIGSKIATPFTDPNPGIAPMNKPTVTPIRIKARLTGCSARNMPSARNENTSIIFLLAGLRQ